MNHLSKTMMVLTILIFSAVQTTNAGDQLEKVRGKLHPLLHLALEQASKTRNWEGTLGPLQPASRESDGTPVVEVILQTSDADAVRTAGVHLNSVFGNFATARVRLSDLPRIAGLNAVTYIDPGSVNYPTLDVSLHAIGASLLHAGFLNNIRYKGAGAIVVIYDTGIDWRHPDFLNPQDATKSRILFIWDQTLTATSGENPPSGFNYGVEYTKAHIEDELDGTPTGYVRQQDSNGHGTHVASTAAGNGAASGGKFIGVAPEADIIVVKGGNASFSESRMIDGLTYAQAKAALLGKPVVVNWSIGGQTGPHDGKRLYEIAIDQMISSPGRAVVVSAGNDGGNPIHVGGTISAGQSATISISVPTYTANSGVQDDIFQLDLWFNGNQAATATVTTPNGITYVRAAGETGFGPDDNDGRIQLFNYQSSLNGHRNINLYVYDADATRPPRAGTWTLQISGLSENVSYDAWLSTRSMAASVSGGNTSKTVSMPATAVGAITVASYVTKWSWPASDGNAYTYSTSFDRSDDISSFSSIGPTRDGRQKPEIAAPGQGIAAALSSSASASPSRAYVTPKYLLIEGTSMAAPHVTGTTALLFGAFPSLTAAQVKALLTTTGTTDFMTGGVPNYTWGYGKLDALKAVAKAVNSSAVVSRDILRYDLSTTNLLAPTITGNTRLALRISPGISGKISRVLFNTTTPANSPIVGSDSVRCELYSVESGVPGTRIGAEVKWPLSRLLAASWNSIPTTDMNASVTVGEDYFIVLSLTNSFNELKLRTDDGSGNTSRSLRFDGSQWVVHSANIRIRAEVVNVSGLVKAEEVASIPDDYELAQNFPNPFNPTSTILYQIPRSSRVTLRVFDLLGRVVRTLVDQEQTAGKYNITWNGTDEVGDPVPSGVYFYRLDADGFSQTRKMMLLK